MRTKVILIMLCMVLLPGLIMAQQISRRDLINSEWQMKSQFYQSMLARSETRIALDQTDYDAKYWKLELNVTDVAHQQLKGVTTMMSQVVANSMTSVEYDFHDTMSVDSVRMNGQPVSFTHSNATLTITLDRTYNNGELFTTVAYYHGHPPGGGFGSFTWDSHNGHTIISTLSEPVGSREWWPCKDQPHDKADSADILITTTTGNTGVSNGVMVEDRDNGDGTHTFHWHVSYPITTYLTCMAVTNYQSFTDWYVGLNGDSLPVTNYVYPELYNQAVEDFNIVPGALGVYASYFGEYPFMREKFGYSLFPWNGGMEHQDNVFYGSALISGNHYYDWITVHEMSHQWFGDAITCDIWPDIWMNEGFASYCEALYYERMQGLSYALNYMRTSNGVTDPSGPIYDPSDLFDGNTVYNKGAWVLQMLRAVMGDSAFFQGMYAYENDPRYQYGTITTREYQHAMEPFYGDSLGWFFDEWVWGQNRPIYRYSYTKQDLGNGQFEVFLHVRQTQVSPAPNVFIMPIKIYPRINNIDTLITVWDDSRINDFRFIVNGNPTTVAFDKYQWILRDASSESYTMNIVTTSLADAWVNTPYADTIEARGGVQPYHFTLQSGQLPTGLSLDGSTGILSGTPTQVEVDSFTVRCTDSSSPVKTDDQDYVMPVRIQTGISQGDNQIPKDFSLIGNYPNPFNASTVIRLQLATPGRVKVDIFNMLGQKVQTLFDGEMKAGENEIVWNGGSVSSGIYFYRVSAGDKIRTEKMTLLK